MIFIWTLIVTLKFHGGGMVISFWHVLAYHTIVLARALRQFEQILSKNDMRITKANSRWDPFSPSSATVSCSAFTLTQKKTTKKAVHKISSACNSLPITIYFSPQRSVWLSHNHSTSPRLDWATTLQAWHQCASANIKWAPSQARAGKAADGNCWQLMACVYWNQFFILFTVR